MPFTEAQILAKLNDKKTLGSDPNKIEISDLAAVLYEIQGAGSSPYYNVLDYGAVGDGVTDDTAAFNAAIAAMPARGGVLYVPATDFKITSTITVSKPIRILGEGPGPVYTDVNNTAQPSLPVPDRWVSRILFNHPITPAFHVTYTGYPSGFEKLDISYNGGTPSAGNCGIRWTGGYGSYLNDITVYNFYDNIRVEQNAAEYSFHNVRAYHNWRYGIYIDNSAIPDYGDFSLSNIVIRSGSRHATAGLYWAGGGGLKISNIKVNGTYKDGVPGEVWQFDDSIVIANSSTTLDVFMINASLENFTNRAVKVAPTGSANLSAVLLSNIETYQNTTPTSPHIDIDGSGTSGSLNNVALNNITILGASPVNGYVRINDADHVVVTNVTPLDTYLTVTNVPNFKSDAPTRMTTAQRDALVSPINGYFIYNTTLDKVQVRAGGVWKTITYDP